MSKKYANVAELLSKLQNQWTGSPEEEDGDEEDEFTIPQEMLDQLVWEEPEESPSVANPTSPASLPSFVTLPQTYPSFVTQPQVQSEPEDVVPDWIPKDWQKDIPSFLGKSQYNQLDIPEFSKQDYPFAKRSLINTVEDAHSLFVDLSKKDKDIFNIIDYVQDALEQIEINPSKKILSITLGNAIGKLKTLSTDNPDVKKAINLFVDYFSSKIPQGYEERTNKNILFQTDKKEKAPQVLTSRFLDPGTIYVRQKTIKIIKDQGLDKDQAENIAKEEWFNIKSFVDNISADPETKNAAGATFVQHLLDGEGWEQAAAMAQRAAASGPDTAGIREQIRNARFDIDDIDDIINDLSNPEIVNSQLQGSAIDNPELVKQIVDFGNTAKEIKNLMDNTEEALDVDESVLERIDDLSNKITSLSNDVLLHNPDELKSILQEYEGDSVLEMIWWVQDNIIRTAKKDFGSEGISETPNLSSSEIATSGLGIEDKRRKENPNAKRRIVDRKKQKEHDRNYHDRAGEALLESKKQYHEKRKQNPEAEKNYQEKQFVKKKDYKLTKDELKIWDILAHSNLDIDSKINKINKIQKENAVRTLEFYDRINNTWKYPDDIEKIKEAEANLIRNRTYRYKDLLDELSKDHTADKRILNELKKHISEVPQYFEQARSIKLKENKVAEIMYYVNSLCKYAATVNI